jgi:outer membrane protein assembly complex protein YaeT
VRAPLSNRSTSLFALAFVLCGKLLAAPEDFEGQTVAAIQFEPAAQPLTAAEMTDLIAPLKPGAPLRSADIRAAIQSLFTTGRFADIQVDASAEPNGVIVRFITTDAFFVGRVKIEGSPDPPSAGQLATAAKLQLGTPFLDTDTRQATDNLLERLRSDGLYNAKVEALKDPQPDVEQMNIDFTIDPGKRAKFGSVVVKGNADKPVEKVIGMTKWKRWGSKKWRPLTEHRLQGGLDNIRSYYQKHDHLMAKVTLDRLDFNPETNSVVPTLQIDAGPLVKVQTSGDKLSHGKLRSLLPIYQERSVDRSLLMEGRRNLVDYFESRGYFDVDVDFDQSTSDDGVQTIEYVIDKGSRHKLVSLKIEGNKFFDYETIRERMFIQPASFLRYRHGRYNERDLSRDVAAVEQLYRSNGFREVKVTSKVDDGYQGHPGDIGVTVHVTEGPQWFVSKLDIDGASEEDQKDLLPVVHSSAGQAYSEFNVAADRDAILSYYYNNGYPQAQFDWAEGDTGENRVSLHYLVTPGHRRFVRDVVVGGLDATKPDFVQKQITLRPGDPLSQIEIAETQARLYDLGIFAKVQTAIQNPDGVEESKYVLYQMEEARRYSMNIGFGAEIARIGGGVTTFDAPAGTGAFSPRVSFGISRLNMFGLGQTLSLQTRFSNYEQRVLISYVIPRFKDRENWTLTLTTLLDNSYDVRTFASRRIEESIQLGQRVSRATTLQYRFNYRDVYVDPASVKITPALIPLFAQSVRDGVLGGSYIFDRRDDPTDAHRGVYNTVDIGLSLKAFGSESQFTRLNVRNASYHRITKDVIFARSTTFGWIQRLGGLPAIPFPERLYSGGASSQRAFPDFQAGPRDPVTGFPLGGTALFLNSHEIRFPLIGDNLGGVLFHDCGNVYTNIHTLSFRFRQENPQDFDYMVHGFGFGIRYRTPVGPIRVDLSLSPNSPRFNGFSGSEAELLQCAPPGQPITCPSIPQRIHIFQFHFSLGQAF